MICGILYELYCIYVEKITNNFLEDMYKMYQKSDCFF